MVFDRVLHFYHRFFRFNVVPVDKYFGLPVNYFLDLSKSDRPIKVFPQKKFRFIKLLRHKKIFFENFYTPLEFLLRFARINSPPLKGGLQ